MVVVFVFKVVCLIDWKVNGENLILFLVIVWWKSFLDKGDSKCSLMLVLLEFIFNMVILFGFFLKVLIFFCIYLRVCIWFNNF